LIGQGLNTGAERAARPHLYGNSSGGHVLRLNLKACRWSRYKTIRCQPFGQGYSDINAAIGCVLIAAPRYASGAVATPLQLSLAQSRNDGTEQYIVEFLNILSSDLQHHPPIMKGNVVKKTTDLEYAMAT
jgi:hypothetical protein